MYCGSKDSDVDFVIGLSCLNGMKKTLFVFNSLPIFSAFPDNPSAVDIPITRFLLFLKII